MNHFEFYGLSVALELDMSALRQAYLLKGKKFHPDFHTLADEAEQANMLELSTQNNEAFKILSDPDKRLRYVLELQGLLGQDTENHPLPQGFLLEMMDINEALMDLEFDFDAASYSAASQKLDILESELKTAAQPILSTWKAASGNDEGLAEVREYYFKRRYLLRIKENLSKFAPLNW